MADKAFDDAIAQVRARIQSEYLAIMPPEKLNELVAEEVRSFFAPKEVLDYGHQRRTTSNFREVCREVMAAHVKELVKAELAKPENEGWWGPEGRFAPGVLVKDWLADNASDVVHAAITHLFGNALQELLQRARGR